MRLSQPTDFLILDALSDGERDTAANIAKRIERKRTYINAELPKLTDQGLVQKIRPHENSGLYRITPLGVAAARNQSLYKKNETEFERTIRQLADEIEIQRPSVVYQPS